AKLVEWLELGAVRPAAPPAFVIPKLLRRGVEGVEGLESLEGLEGLEGEGPMSFSDGDDALVDLHLRAQAPARIGLAQVFELRVELSREALERAPGFNAALASALVEQGEQVTVEVVPRARVVPVAYAPVAVAVPPRGAVTGL